ncbi:predicted protein [Coccidioides posadasii str. Silveira]|uniref:Predicted protein n=1 Tax=Coccidioides posadasii (strain RMSCC 757 / Silveira) TaxID=443226 RepID=E9D1F7_COCPS|nr:predicted protein [Coccidioides posadasii str. Silveira]
MAEERHPPEDLHSRRRTLRPTPSRSSSPGSILSIRRLSIPHINTPRRQTLPSLVRIPHGCIRKQSTWALFYTIPYVGIYSPDYSHRDDISAGHALISAAGYLTGLDVIESPFFREIPGME